MSFNKKYINSETDKPKLKVISRARKNKPSQIISLINDNLNDILIKKTNSFDEKHHCDNHHCGNHYSSSHDSTHNDTDSNYECSNIDLSSGPSLLNCHPHNPIGLTGSTGAIGPIGPTGSTGVSGTQIICGELLSYGTTAPNDAAKVGIIGNVGDICLVLDSGVLYEWNGVTWQIVQPQTTLPYYYYDTNTHHIFYITQLGVPPLDFIGTIGDVFLDTITCDLYIQTTNGWILKCELKGDTGPTGPTMYINSSITGVTGNTNLNTFTEIYNLLGPGTDTVNLISIDVAIRGDTNGLASLQLDDTLNSQTLATISSIPITSTLSTTNLGPISNQSTSMASWSLYAKIDSGLNTLGVPNMLLTYSK